MDMHWELMNVARRWANGRRFEYRTLKGEGVYKVYVRLSEKQKARHVASVPMDWDGNREGITWVADKPEGF